MDESLFEPMVNTLGKRVKRRELWTEQFLLEAFLSECDDNNTKPSLDTFLTWMDGDCESHPAKAKTVVAIV
jgi:hypothetical protein